MRKIRRVNAGPPHEGRTETRKRAGQRASIQPTSQRRHIASADRNTGDEARIRAVLSELASVPFDADIPTRVAETADVDVAVKAITDAYLSGQLPYMLRRNILERFILLRCQASGLRRFA